MAKNTFKVGLIGCGQVGSTFDDDPKRKYVSTHLGAYKYVKDTNVIAVCDTNRKRLQKCQAKWNIPRGYNDYKKMLQKEKLDIVSICTPTDTHYAILKDAANFHLKAVFCEKPLVTRVNDVKKIVDLYKNKKIILQVDHQRRFDPLHLKIRNIIQDKKLGEVQQVSFYYTAGIKNTGSHMFDLLRFFFGDIKWIEGIYSKNSSRNAKDPNVDGILKFKSDIIATFQACDVKKYSIFELNCLLESGRIVIKDSGFSADFQITGKSQYFSGYKGLYKVKAPFRLSYKRNFMINAVSHLAGCIRGKQYPISSGEDAEAALGLITSTLYSAKNNGKRIALK